LRRETRNFPDFTFHGSQPGGDVLVRAEWVVRTGCLMAVSITRTYLNIPTVAVARDCEIGSEQEIEDRLRLGQEQVGIGDQGFQLLHRFRGDLERDPHLGHAAGAGLS
jgi:hypothetical protein